MTTDHTETILVAYATKHGSTKEVAEAIATQLERTVTPSTCFRRRTCEN